MFVCFVLFNSFVEKCVETVEKGVILDTIMPP